VTREMLVHPLRFMRDHRFTQTHASDYLDAELERRERDRVEHHARVCPKCWHLLESLKRTIAELSRLRGAEPDVDVAADVIARLHSEA
jgi:anti-sigma factor RsiW